MDQAVANPDKPIARDVIKEIALDIGKAVVSHIETMYPRAVEATSKSMLVSVRNFVYNEILDALKTTDESEIRRRLENRRIFRRASRKVYKNLRESKS